LFRKEEGCLPSINEFLPYVEDMANCSPRRAFARLRQAILNEEAIARWDDEEQDFLLDFGPRGITESTSDLVQTVDGGGLFMILLLLLFPLFLLTESQGDGDGEEEGEKEKEEEGEGEEEGGNQGKDPQKHIANLEDKVRRLAMKLDKKDAEIKKRDRGIKELEEQVKATSESEGDDLRSARLHNQFLRSAIALSDPIDVTTGWDLMTARGYLDGIKDITEDAMAEALERLTSDYPWLVNTHTDEDSDDQPSPLPRTRHPGAQRADQQRLASASQLKKRFPALRGRMNPVG